MIFFFYFLINLINHSFTCWTVILTTVWFVIWIIKTQVVGIVNHLFYAKIFPTSRIFSRLKAESPPYLASGDCTAMISCWEKNSETKSVLPISASAIFACLEGWFICLSEIIIIFFFSFCWSGQVKLYDLKGWSQHFWFLEDNLSTNSKQTIFLCVSFFKKKI